MKKAGVGFLTLSALLVAYGIVQAIREPWVGDFWEHAAVVRELAADPWSPSHPELGIDAPHAFISPHSLLVAAVVRLGGVDAVQALGIVGVLNLLLLLAGIRLFVGILSPGRTTRVAFYCLLFVLLLWGRRPWTYSGFFGVLSIGYVMPYPSTFAAGLALVTIFVWRRWIERASGGLSSLAGIALSAAILLVTHPPTWFFLVIGLIAFAVHARAGRRAWTALGLCLLVAAGLASLWPYYPVWRLAFEGQAAFHLSNKFMYERVPMRAAPVLIAIPLILWNASRSWRDPVFLMSAALLVVYAFGRLTGGWNYGRSLPFLIFLGHAQIAVSLAAAEARLARPAARRLVPVAVTVACVLLSFWWQILPAARALRTDDRMRDDFGFLGAVVGRSEVVVTDLDTGWYVPAFGGKVVASRHPVAFVADHEEREDDLRRFFRAGTERAERDAILRKYGARFVLIDKARAASWPVLEPDLRPLGRPVVETGRWVLLDRRL